MKKKLSESITLGLRKKVATSNTKTLLLVLILIVTFAIINVAVNKYDLPKYDLTENKIYSLTEQTKSAIEKVDREVKVYVLGFDEKSNAVDFLKQYNQTNSRIEYEIITETENKEIISQYGLEPSVPSLTFVVGDVNKVVYQNELSTYDYTIYQQVDLTENVMTNTILNLTIANKPTVYFSTGHNELSVEKYLTQFITLLSNEVFDYKNINLLSGENIPDDCKLIVVMCPQKDLVDSERDKLLEFINKGGNIIYTTNYTMKNNELANWQKVLDVYGVSVDKGAVYETNSQNILGNSPFYFCPNILNSSITSTIYTDGALALEYAQKLNLPSTDKYEELHVDVERLLTTSEEAFFLPEVSQEALMALANSNPQPVQYDIAAKITKEITAASEDGATPAVESSLIIYTNGESISNIASEITNQLSKAMLLNNSEFVVNCIANLTDREDSISIRKETNSSTYAPTQQQNLIVLAVIFITPVIIILIGVVVWRIRLRKR